MRTVLCTFLVLSMASPALAQSKPEYSVVVGARAPATRVDQPPPAGFHRERRFDWGMFATGLGAFALGYGASAAFAPVLSNKGGDVMAIPFVGPFLMMGNVQEAGSGCNSSKAMCLPSDSRSKMMSGLGSLAALQFVGFGLFVASFFTSSTVVVRDSKALVSNVHVAPVVTGGFSGVTFSGSF